MQVLLQKTHRRSKPIKKQEKIINHNLKRKKIFLDKENFDIVGVLQQALRTQQIRQDQGPAQRSTSRPESMRYEAMEIDRIEMDGAQPHSYMGMNNTGADNFSQCTDKNSMR